MENHVGFRFHPTDEEILNHYLWNKMAGRSDLTRAIAEIDVYGCEPWELPARSQIQSDDQVWYFFYRQNKRSCGGWNRRTGQGFWKKTGQDREIRVRGSRSEIGTRKTLVFYNGRFDKAARTGWVMHEYSPTPSAAPPDAMAYVVCRIKYKGDDKNELLAPSASSNNNASASNALPEARLQQNIELVNRQMEADFELAFQEFIRDGLSIEDLSPRSDSNNDQDWMQDEEGISLNDILQFEGDGIERVAMQTQVDTIEQEDDFVNSMFADQYDQLSDQDVYNVLNDHGPSSSSRRAYVEDSHDMDSQLFDQIPRNSSMYNSGSREEHQKRMENTVKHDDILLMNPSGVDSRIATGFEVNPTYEKPYVPSRKTKPQYESRPNRAGAVPMKGPTRKILQGDLSSEAAFRNKARNSAEHGVSMVHIGTEASISKSNKGQQMNKQTVTKSCSTSNRHGSASSGRKSSSSSSTVTEPAGGEIPPSAYICNVAVGLMIFVFIVWQAWP